MFRSTDAPTTDQDSQTVSAGGMATPYFMLIQMNNAALLEAYATLGIQPVVAEIKDCQFPDGFNLTAALAPMPRGAEDRAEHPGKIFANAEDPIKEVEGQTHGSADNILSLAQSVASRFGEMISDGADFGAMIENALTMTKLPGLDFDPDIIATGASVLANSSGITSATSDFAGQAPFSGFRADYRPETAPGGGKKTTPRKHSLAAKYVVRDGGFEAALTKVAQEVYRSRDRGAGTGARTDSGTIRANQDE